MFFHEFQLDPYAAMPKYMQLVNAILSALENGKLKEGDFLPSIIELSAELYISRGAAEKCYKSLKSNGMLDSIPAKGYSIKAGAVKKRLRIFLLFNKLSTHKKIIYNSFIATLETEAMIDFYIYNNDYILFRKIFSERNGDYTYYVVIPHFIDDSDLANNLINTLAKEKLLLFDKNLPFITGKYAAVYQRFEEDIYEALEQMVECLAKYDTIKFVFPKHSYYPKQIVNGFLRFCRQYAFDYIVLDRLDEKDPMKGVAYIIVLEEDFASLIEDRG